MATQEQIDRFKATTTRGWGLFIPRSKLIPQAGHNGIAVRCPIHGESTPSLIMYADGGMLASEGRWHCLGCGERGFYDLMGEIEGPPEKEYWYELRPDSASAKELN